MDVVLLLKFTIWMNFTIWISIHEMSGFTMWMRHIYDIPIYVYCCYCDKNYSKYFENIIACIVL